MIIKELINEMEYEILAGSEETEITTLVYDSRKVEKGSVFVCISGSVRDAHEFIPDVAAKGAAAIVVEKDVTPIDGITYIKVEDSRLAAGCPVNGTSRRWNRTAVWHLPACLRHILGIRQKN